ncbi:uncharacterized protein [Clytia hemisphaerica]|uniref:Uncharacterized protein n=1 Tax=Clytia hemisphaerica TaxID=252671 RepID=A0A7M5X5I7_9CNID
MSVNRKESDASGTKEHRSRSGNGRSVSNIVRKLSHRSSGKRSTGGYNKGNMIPPHCKFKLVVQTVKPELTVCFMLAETPGYALTCNKTEDVYAEKVINDIKFWERCSFIPSVNLWYDGYCAFESVRESSRYLLFVDGKFYFKKYDGTERFKKDASFLFTKQVNIFSPRRSQSNIIPPDPNKLKVKASGKSRKFSLISFRSSERNNAERHSELQQMIPSGVLPVPEMVIQSQSKKEMYCLGLNQCRDCLTLTNFQYISERLAKQEERSRSHSGLLSLNSSVTLSEAPPDEIELLTLDASSI